MPATSTLKSYLETHGPTLSSQLVRWLVDQGLKADAARKRLSRARPPIRSFPIPLFPKGERFLYLEDQRREERFFPAMQSALRDSGSVYGMALDGVIARRGAVSESEFAVISGATVQAVKKQVQAETVLKRLVAADLLRNENLGDDRIITLGSMAPTAPDYDGIKARATAEKIVLDGLREWARNIGAASYNQIRIRGEPELLPIQQFKFDLAGPSYLLSLRRGVTTPGFLVADVFANGPLNEYEIRYFVRKAQALHATLRGATVLPMLIADGFTGPALTAGHGAGILMATPSALFGTAVGTALRGLVETLGRAAAYASADTPNRLIDLVNSLSSIEGRAGNLRGILFELMAAYLARRDAVSIDMGVRATHRDTGAKADIDVLKVTQQNAECVAIQCKGKEPGGAVSIDDVADWLNRIKTVSNFLRGQERFREAAISHELWTSGGFSPQALERLEAEKPKRTQFPISWKTGTDVLALARKHKEKAMADAIEQHFIRHPLVGIAKKEGK